MEKTTPNQQKNQQDTLQRIDQYLNVLEERTTALLSNIDFDAMTPYQRVQATCHLLTLTMRLLKLRQDSIPPYDYESEYQELVMQLIQYGVDEKGKLMLPDNT